MNNRHVWFKHNNDWCIGELCQKTNQNQMISSQNGHVIDNKYFELSKVYYNGKEHVVNKYYPYKDLQYREINDVINLPLLDEPSILQSIHSRFELNHIYTNCGEILISVNPFRFTDLYTDDKKKAFKDKLGNGGCNESHIYNNANKSYYYLSKFNKNQSILISGESGAGKTQSTKIIIDYLTYLSNPMGNANDSKTSSIQSKIIHANPILEAFGNAKTIKNDNSSRFGKFIKLYFDNNSNHICGGTIETFLLEKVRVIKQNGGERNFHIFYEFLNGASQEIRDCLQFNKFFNKNDSYLSNGSMDCDADNFRNLSKLLYSIGIDHDKQNDIWKIITFIIVMSEYSYELKMDKLQYLATLLNTNMTSLMEVLYTKRIIVNDESIHSEQTEEEFYEARESLVMKLYSRLFEYIVATVNENISLSGNEDRFIGILDIFGFESLETNSFEQLCINYANETLQNQFNKYSLEQEQKEYELEGIKWDYITFTDNIECIQLLSGKMGVFKILDEQCKVPNGNDITFLGRMNKELETNKYYQCNNVHNQQSFTIKHYADKIDYQITSFCDKNKDVVSNEIMKLVNGFDLFKSNSVGGCNSDNNNNNNNISRIGSKTISNQFVGQMTDLMSIIEHTGIHYVRCFKPNDKDSPLEFNRIKILEQLQNNGILEAIKVSRHSFPIKYKYADFKNNYHMLLDGGEVQEKIECLDEKTYQFGKTKIFLKTDAFNALENKKEKRINELVIKLQSIGRKYISRVDFLLQKSSALIITTKIRQLIAKCRVDTIRKTKRVITIQTSIRRFILRSLYLRKKKSINRIIHAIRLFIIVKRNRASSVITRLFRGHKRWRISRVICIQSIIRKYIYSWRYQRIKKGILTFQKAVRRKLFNTGLLKQKIENIQSNLDKAVEDSLRYELLVNEKDTVIKNKDEIIHNLETRLNDSTIINEKKDVMMDELSVLIKQLQSKLNHNNNGGNHHSSMIEEDTNKLNELIDTLKSENDKLKTFKKKLFESEMNIHRLKEDNNSYVGCLKKNIERRLEVQKELDIVKDENKYIRQVLDQNGIRDDYILL